MKFALNVISSILAVTAVSAFTAACSSQDTMQGRTYTKVEAQKFFAKYSSDELKQFCAKDENVKSCNDLKLIPKQSSPSTSSTETSAANGAQPQQTATGTGQNGAIAPSAPAASGVPAVPAPAKTEDAQPAVKPLVPDIKSEQENPIKIEVGAQNKVIVEYADFSDLIKKNKLALDGGVNGTALQLVQGLTASLNTTSTGLSLIVEAAVTLNGQAMHLYVKDAPVSFSNDGKVPAIDFRLTDLTEDEVDPKDLVKVTAVCVAEGCEEVQLRLDFLFPGNMSVPAVYALDRNTGYAIKATNLATSKDIVKLLSFESARDHGTPMQKQQPRVKPVAAPSPDKASSAPTETPKAKTDVKTTTPEAPAGPLNSDKQSTTGTTDAAGFHAAIAKLDKLAKLQKPEAAPFTLVKPASAVVGQGNLAKTASKMQLADSVRKGSVALPLLMPKSAPITNLQSTAWKAAPVAVKPAVLAAPAAKSAPAPAPAATPATAKPAVVATRAAPALQSLTANAGLSAAQMKASLALKTLGIKPIAANGNGSMALVPATAVKAGSSPALNLSPISDGSASFHPFELQPSVVQSTAKTNAPLFSARLTAAKNAKAAAAEKAKEAAAKTLAADASKF